MCHRIRNIIYIYKNKLSWKKIKEDNTIIAEYAVVLTNMWATLLSIDVESHIYFVIQFVWCQCVTIHGSVVKLGVKLTYYNLKSIFKKS